MIYPQGSYRLVLADPPWRFKVRCRETGLGRAPDRHYKTMKTEEICALPIRDMAARHALLAMWVYDPMLPAAFKISQAWDFEFVTVLFRWLKINSGQYRLFDPGEKLEFGQGYHTRGGACEECWLFKRGDGLPVLRHDIRKEFFSLRREHSRKPDEVADWLVDLYGDVPRIELFARTPRPGWDAFGDEVGKFSLKQGGEHEERASS